MLLPARHSAVCNEAVHWALRPVLRRDDSPVPGDPQCQQPVMGERRLLEQEVPHEVCVKLPAYLRPPPHCNPAAGLANQRLSSPSGQRASTPWSLPG